MRPGLPSWDTLAAVGFSQLCLPSVETASDSLVPGRQPSANAEPMKKPPAKRAPVPQLAPDDIMLSTTSAEVARTSTRSCSGQVAGLSWSNQNSPSYSQAPRP